MTPPDRRPFSGAQRGWWFDDAIPGRTLLHPGGRTIGADEQVLLAWWTNNASPVHGDLARAAGTEFGGPLVLGALSVAVVVGLAAPAVGPPTTAHRVASPVWHEVRLLGVVRPGDTLSARSRIERVEPDAVGSGGMVHRTIEGRTQDGLVVVRVRERGWVPGR